ncbi:MAG TPA: alpha/beta fold hydrolase [Blastocatellia bacterium]|nr:alpha/beta fold hydrolase [Blastocatellia bacterium]
MRLFCFPYAGGGASLYKSWADSLPSSVEVCPVQPPGREGRRGEAPFTRLLPLVKAISERIEPLLNLPYAFFGHSLGAKIAFELARDLQRGFNLNPACLFISACPAPQMPNEAPAFDLPDDRFVERMRRLNGVPEHIDPHRKALRVVLPCIRADVEMYDTYTYVPGPLLRCPIVVLGGDRDPLADLNQLSCWRDLTSSRFSLQMLSGDHFFLRTIQPSILRIVSEELNTIIQTSLPPAREPVLLDRQ